MGPVMVAATYYVQAQAVSGEALLLSLPVGFLVTAILVVNDLRDMEEDRAQGKMTPVTALGKPFAVTLFRLLLIGAFLSVLLMASLDGTRLSLLAVLVTLPKAYAAARRVAHDRPRPILGEALRHTAGLHLYFGLLLAAGLAARRLLGP
jgi:1,4-dihydroxy-2-naphthoate octaprenyltransferase